MRPRLYRLRGFKDDINPNEVSITCAKEGYTALRVFRRPLPKGKPVKAVETECRLKTPSCRGAALGGRRSPSARASLYYATEGPRPLRSHGFPP